MQIRQSPSSVYRNWIQDDNITHTLQKARAYCALINQYTPRNTYNQPSNSAQFTSMNASNLNQLKAQFKSELLAASDIQACIFTWRNKERRSCVFHPNQAHKFFQCRVTSAICSECNMDNQLQTAIRNSNESTRRLNAERNAANNANANQQVEPPEQLNARRVQLPAQTNVLGEQLVTPPTPPRRDEYESGSNLSSSTLNSTNTPIDPYLSFKCNPSLTTSPRSILNPPKTPKTVSFHPDIVANEIPKLQLQEIPQHHSKTMAITDSGSTDDLSCHREMFEYLIPLKTPKYAKLGDDKTLLQVPSYGMMNYILQGHRIRRIGYFVPELGTTLISIKKHMQYDGCYFHAENNMATLAFPNAILNVNIHPEMHVMIEPASKSTIPYTFDESEAILTQRNVQRRKYTTINKNAAEFLPKHQLHEFTKLVRVKKLVKEARLPSRATPGAAGFDVCAITDAVIPPHSQKCIHTSLAIAIPTGMYLRLASRSSLALQGINVTAGVIDNDYRGEIKVLLQNTTNKPFKVSKDSRIAQCLFENNSIPCIVLSNNLPKTIRDKGGFGSTSKSDDMALINRIIAKQAVLKDKQSNSIKHHKLNDDPDTDEHLILISNSHPVPTSKSKSPSIATPVPPAENSVNHSLPKTASYTKDFVAQATGFYNNDNIIKYLPLTGCDNITITKSQAPPLSDEGFTATMRSRRRNTKPTTTKYNYSDVWHMDIGFGPTTAIGGIRYSLLLVDKATKYRRMYPLKNLTTSITRALKSFLTDVGTTPKLIRTDFDKKLIGSTAREYLESKHIKIQSAPPKRQHQNGLVERAWQSAVIMSRNWMKSALLPSKYWYFALKRAIEISNISPTKIDNKVTTPFEAVHQQKVDYRQLFPMFATSYIKQETDSGKHKNKWKSQSLKVICVGSCPDSDGLLFYHPHSKSLLSCGDNYYFDTYLPAGPQFGESYDGRITIHTKSALQNIHSAPSHEANDTVFFKHSENNYKAAKILSTPFDEDNDVYVIQLQKSGSILHVMNDEIFDTDPTTNPQEDPVINHMLPWMKNNSKITIILPEFDTKPKQGYLLQSDADDEWYFIPGRKPTNTPIHLSKFNEKALSMYHNQKLFKGWVNTRQAATARTIRLTSNVLSHMITARHVSAKDLINMEAPLSLLKHSKLHPNDKRTWDESYKEEYDGLKNLDTWEVITEDQYNTLKKTSKAKLLPTMAISVIKYDGDGQPIRAKYRIVVLGNLDPHGWEKHDCFAPVLNQFELRLLLHLAVQHGCIPKQGDVSQAFCQAILPENETYVCRPPPGCPITPKNAYWRLLKSLYGMKRSPRHWYDKAHSILTAIGLVRSPNSPCVYAGEILPGHPPIYLGLYVDDFIFFSKSQAVEDHFQKEFAKHVTKVTYSSQVDYFLGIKFDCTRQLPSHVTIQLSQAAFAENLLIQHNMHTDDINSVQSPFRSGLPIDKIPNEPCDPETQHKYTKQMQSIVGSLTWLSMSTRPDLSTVTNMLAKYVTTPSAGHITAAKRVLRYIKGTKHKGITFSTTGNSHLAAYIKFPLPPNPIALTDANWGPQDQSVPKPSDKPQELELFKTRSLSGFIVWGHGPIHWISKRQSLTVRSSAEAEIVATDECVKFLLHLRNVCDDLNINTFIFPNTIDVYNDNAACIKWSKNMTTKGLRYIQIRENAVREAVQSKIVRLIHIDGKINIADLFTKEDKDVSHFVSIRDILVQDVPTSIRRQSSVSAVQRGVSTESPSSVGS